MLKSLILICVLTLLSLSQSIVVAGGPNAASANLSVGVGSNFEVGTQYTYSTIEGKHQVLGTTSKRVFRVSRVSVSMLGGAGVTRSAERSYPYRNRSGVVTYGGYTCPDPNIIRLRCPNLKWYNPFVDRITFMGTGVAGAEVAYRLSDRFSLLVSYQRQFINNQPDRNQLGFGARFELNRY